MIMRLFVVHIPTLKPLSGDIETWFSENCTRRKLRLRKSNIQPMGTSGIDESTASGGSEVLHDLAQQMELNDDSLKNFLVMVIFKTHWPDETGPDTFINLRHGFESIGRSFNPTKCDFYPGHEGLKAVFDTLVLTSALEILKGSRGDASDTAPGDQHSHMLSDLRTYFASGGKLENCTLAELQGLAGSIYDRFMTTEAYLKASSVTDLDLEESELTKAMGEMMATVGQKKRKSKSRAEATAPGPGAGMNLDDDGSEDSSTSSGAEAMDGVQPAEGILASNLGDTALGNAVLLMRDAFWYLEFATAITEGDIGRVFEIIKVLRFSFWGGGATNYGNELLELACNYFYEYPEKLQDAILNNYLVNPSGLPNHWHELDLLRKKCECN
ncbi:hypothetical protein FRC12_005056 [Ceratobasidium sp. 428]|nr:hypothetical protein FRC12_005056 [Ceratobasidium sp. 428]